HELIQNAFDAHPASCRDGEIAILLDRIEGEHVVLYVANRGIPFDLTDFEDICTMGRSDKPVAEAIGNKGIGFKSVLEICDYPQIYSQDATCPGSDRFSGYCFTFPGLNELRALLNGDEDLAIAAHEQ